MVILNPVWLRSFRAVVDHGSFTRAADALDLTQAAVSQHIRHIEDFTSEDIFLRRGRKIDLTPAGKAVLVYADDVDTAARRLDARLEQDGPLCGDLRIATPGSSGLRIYNGLLDLQQAQPDIKIHHRFAPTEDIITSIIEDRAELGVITRLPDDPRLTALKLATEPIELVVPANVDIGDFDDLLALGFIDHPDGRAMATRLLGQRFRAFSGMRSVACHGFSNQITLILEPVARGLGFTVLPRFACQAFHKRDQIKTVAFSEPVLDSLYMIHRSEWPISPLAKYITGEIRRMLNEG